MKLTQILFVLLISLFTLSGCSGMKEFNKSMREGIKKHDAGDRDLKVKTKLITHYKWLPDPKPGCGMIPINQLDKIKMVKIAKIDVFAATDIRTGKDQKYTDGFIQRRFQREACAIGGDGYMDEIFDDHQASGTVWAFKDRMKIKMD